MPAVLNPSSGTRYTYDLGSAGEAARARSSAPSAYSAEVESGLTAAPAAVRGVSVGGQRAHVALLHVNGGAGCPLHACAAEKFVFVLQGSLCADINGRLVEVAAQSALHVPAGMPHALHATEPASFIVALSRESGPAARYFDSADAQWRDGEVARARPQTQADAGGERCFVYAIDRLDAAPATVTSAKVVPKNFVSGKSSSFGAALSGTALHVGVIHKARGSGAKLHTHPNEQFNVVLEGRLLGEIAGAPMDVAPYGLIHMPAGVPHCTMASADGDITVFVVKDTSHGLSGPPVDGIEDGPRYLPGFGPKA